MANETKIPNHIAIILDGNGTWARKRGLPRVMGHRKGAQNIATVTKCALERGVKYLTLFCFSTENWNRPKEEVEYLMSLPEQLLNEYEENMEKDSIRFKVIGCTDNLSEDMIVKMREIEEKTKDNNKMTLIIAFNYGSKRELIDATKAIASEIKDNKIKIEDIDENLFADKLYTKGIPDVDLLIRTSGQYRLSNFLLWQCAYTEFYFPSTLWPDFKAKDLDKAIAEYTKRERRFGGIK